MRATVLAGALFAALLIAVLSEAVYAAYPFIDDFHAFEYVPLWQSSNFRDIVIGNDNIVTVYWDININDSWRNPYLQLYYRRFTSAGLPLTEPRLLTDSSNYSVWTIFDVARNQRGRSIIADHILRNCPEWMNCVQQVMVWVSNDNGEFLDSGIVVGRETSPEYLNDYPVAALDSSGNFVVCWANLYNAGIIWCQLFYADKTPRSDTIRVAPRNLPSGELMTDPENPKIKMAPKGDFVIAWKAQCSECQGSTLTYYTMVRTFYADGTPKSNVICASCYGDTTNAWKNGGYYPDLALAGNGDFALTWYRLYNSSSHDCKSMVMMRRFYADGTPKGQQVMVDSGICDYYGIMIPTIASDSAGNIVVAWGVDKDSQTGSFNLMAQRFDSEGNRVGEKYRINDHYLSVRPTSEPVAMNDRGLVGFFWDDVNGASLKDDKAYYPDMIQLMDLQDVGRYVPGDANNDHLVDISDAVYLISYIFAGGHASAVPCLGDVDGDDSVDISDVVALVSYIFSGGSIAGQCPG